MIRISFLLLFLLIGYFGVHNVIVLLNSPRNGSNSCTRYVHNSFKPGSIYLIPTDLESFRMAAKVPVFIDFKSNPYKDYEVIEWYDRNKIANNFYSTEGKEASKILEEISGKYGITHVVMRNDNLINDCKGLHEVYKDNDFRIYEVDRTLN